MDLSLSGNAGFAQTGQVDWVALGDNTVSATVAVFARLAAAKVDAQTVAVAHALSGGFKLSVAGENLLNDSLGSYLILYLIGQKRIKRALTDLNGCSSISDVLWFGFGIQHPIRHLGRTENGYSCIALCGALSTISSDLEAAAVILTEFADIKGAPQYLRPSLHQWHELLKTCSGSLITTKFECIANQYMLLSGTLGKSGPAFVGEPRDVALALDAFGRLSRGDIAAITLAGGAICGWLAAFAHVFLDLEIELHDKMNNLVMKTVADNKRVHIIVRFGTTTSHDVQLSSTSYYIRDAQDLLKPRHSLQTGRVPWEEIIQRVFGSQGTKLLEARRPFGTLIGCAARIFAAAAHNDKDFTNFLESQERPISSDSGSVVFYRDWIGYNADSFGRGYINFAIETLHELKVLRDTIEPCLNYPVTLAITEYKAASLEMKQICPCKNGDCRETCDPAGSCSRCIYYLGAYIIKLLWQLSLIEVSTMIQPTQHGLRKFFESSWDLGFDQLGSIDQLLSHLTLLRTYRAAMQLFSGHHLGDVSELHPAQVSQGLCFFVDTLVEISDRPETRKFLHIVPGTIEGPSGTHFDLVKDGDFIN